MAPGRILACLIKRVVTFILISFSWIFFRAQSLEKASLIIYRITHRFLFSGVIRFMAKKLSLGAGNLLYNLDVVYGWRKVFLGLLVVLIMTLIATTAFIFFRYLLPNVTNTEVPVSTEQVGEDTQPEQTEQLNDEIPCEALALTSGGTITFTEEGQMRLLNVVIIPSDSTDKLVYASSDENVATVNDEGRVTAVGEGEAVITITCGKRQMQCNVTCNFATEATETEAAGEAG